MIRHRSTVLLAACVTCWALALDASTNSGLEPAIAYSSANLPPPILLAESPSPTATERPILKPGSQGTDVSDLQKKLKELGYYDGIADGIYGASTEAAVSKFQKSVGLEADGIAAALTWERMEEAQAAKSPPKAAAATAKPPDKHKGWRRLLIALVVTMAIAGGGVFFLRKWLHKPKKAVQPSSLPDETDLPTGNSPVNRVETQTETLNPEHHTNSNNNSSLTVSRPNSPEIPSKAEISDGTLAINQTTRLAKINIIDELIKDLARNDPQKRRKAIWELAQRGDSRAVQPLVDLMLDSDSIQRSLILEALSQIGVKTLQPMNRALIVSLQDDNAEVRKNAIRELTQIYDMLAQMTQILGHAAYDPDPEVQETAKWAMTHLSRIRTLETLDNFPPSPNSSTRSDNQPKEPPR